MVPLQRPLLRLKPGQKSFNPIIIRERSSPVTFRDGYVGATPGLPSCPNISIALNKLQRSIQRGDIEELLVCAMGLHDENMKHRNTVSRNILKE